MSALSSWKVTWRRMPKLARALVWTLAALAGLYAILAGALTILLPPARLAAWVTPRLQAAVGARTEVEGVRLRVFPGIAIRVERLTVENPQGFSDRPLFSLDALELRPRILPLLAREIAVAEVRLIRPRLLVEANASGAVNLKALAAARPPADTAEGAEGARRGGPAAFAVSRLVVADGIILYDDRAGDRAFRVGDVDAELSLRGNFSGGDRFESQANVELGDLQARFAGSDTVTALPSLAWAADAAVRLDPDSAHLREVRLRWGEVQVAGSGTLTRFRSPERAIDITLEAQGIDAGKLLATLPNAGALRGYRAAGVFDLALAASGRLGGGQLPQVNAELSFHDVGLTAPTGQELWTGMSGGIRVRGQTATADAIRAQILGRPATLRFTTSGILDPTLDARFVADLDLARFAALREGGAEMDGRVGLDLQIAGKPRAPASLRVTGPVTLSDVVVRGPTPAVPVRIPKGALRFTGRGLRADDLQLEMGRSDLTLSVQAANAVATLGARADRPLASVTLSARSRRLDWTELFPETSDEISYSQLMWARLADRPVNGRSVDQVAEEQQFALTALPPIEAQGRVAIDTFIQTNLRATDVTLDVTLRDGVLTLSDLRASVYGGRARGETTVDFRGGPPYAAEWSFVAESLQAAAFLDRFTGLQKAVSGTLTFQVTGQGEMDRYLLPLRDALRTDVRGLLVNGAIQDWGPTNALAAFLNNERLKTIRVQQWVGGLEIVGSQVRLRDWSLAGERLAATVAGAFGLDGTLDAALRLQFDSAFARQLGGGATGALLIQGASSWLALQMKGPARNPNVGLDTEAMRQIAAGAVQQKIAEEQKQVREQVEKKLQEEVGGRLRQLFGGRRDTTKADTTKRDTTPRL